MWRPWGTKRRADALNADKRVAVLEAAIQLLKLEAEEYASLGVLILRIEELLQTCSTKENIAQIQQEIKEVDIRLKAEEWDHFNLTRNRENPFFRYWVIYAQRLGKASNALDQKRYSIDNEKIQ